MKYKIGDKIRIRSKKEIENQEISSAAFRDFTEEDIFNKTFKLTSVPNNYRNSFQIKTNRSYLQIKKERFKKEYSININIPDKLFRL